MYFRFTGAGDLKRVADFAKAQLPGGAAADKKGPGGETVTVVSSPTSAPAFAFVGDSEVIMAGFKNQQGRHTELIDQVLVARAADRPAGPLTEALRLVPDKAFGFYVGELSEELRAQMTRGGPVRAVPHRLAVSLTRGKDAELQFNGTLKDADEAKGFVEDVNKLKQQGIDALKGGNLPVPIPAATADEMVKALEGLKLEAREASVHGRFTVSPGLAKAVTAIFTPVPVRGPRPLPPREIR
jgi:hypothetical protein